MFCANSLTLLKIQDKLVRKGKTTPTGEWTAPLGLLNFRNRQNRHLSAKRLAEQGKQVELSLSCF